MRSGLLGEPRMEYYKLLDDGYARWGFEWEILDKGLSDSIGVKAVQGLPGKIPEAVNAQYFQHVFVEIRVGNHLIKIRHRANIPIPQGKRSEEFMSKRYYIAYGSNLSTEQMAFRTPDAKIVGKAILYGWQLLFKLQQPRLRRTKRKIHRFCVGNLSGR